MKQQDPFTPNFLEGKDGRFSEVQSTCESVFRQLERRVLELISPNKTASTSKEENMLWNKKILGTSNPLMLQRAVFFFSVGKVFCFLLSMFMLHQLMGSGAWFTFFISTLIITANCV